MKEYFYESEPTLYRDSEGKYLAGLAELFGTHLCNGYPEPKQHTFVNNKCAECGIQIKEQTNDQKRT